jgi:hypothetical protein
LIHEGVGLSVSAFVSPAFRKVPDQANDISKGMGTMMIELAFIDRAASMLALSALAAFDRSASAQPQRYERVALREDFKEIHERQ